MDFDYLSSTLGEWQPPMHSRWLGLVGTFKLYVVNELAVIVYGIISNC
jgi:hypothetical protein